MNVKDALRYSFEVTAPLIAVDCINDSIAAHHKATRLDTELEFIGRKITRHLCLENERFGQILQFVTMDCTAPLEDLISTAGNQVVYFPPAFNQNPSRNKL